MARCQDRRAASALRTRRIGTGCIPLSVSGQAHSDPHLTPPAPGSFSLLCPKPLFPPRPFPDPSEMSCSTTGSDFEELCLSLSGCYFAHLPLWPIPSLGLPVAHIPSQHQHPQRDLTQNSHYLSESRSYLSRFLSGESICWNFSLRSFPLSLCLPFTTERTR